MNINVIKFFEKYNSDPGLYQRIQDAVAAYPGSLELRGTCRGGSAARCRGDGSAVYGR